MYYVIGENQQLISCSINILVVLNSWNTWRVKMNYSSITSNIGHNSNASGDVTTCDKHVKYTTSTVEWTKWAHDRYCETANAKKPVRKTGTLIYRNSPPGSPVEQEQFIGPHPSEEVPATVAISTPKPITQRRESGRSQRPPAWMADYVKK